MVFPPSTFDFAETGTASTRSQVIAAAIPNARLSVVALKFAITTSRRSKHLEVLRNQHFAGEMLLHIVDPGCVVTAWWNDVPRGTMDEVSSYVRLDLPFVYGQGRV